MKLKYSIFFIVFLFLKNSNGQDLLNASGRSLVNSSFEFSISIGEMITSTIGDTSALITQGFLQPSIPSTSISYVQTRSGISCFPNPFSERLYIDFKTEYSQLIIVDQMGRQVYESKIPESELNIGYLIPGMYQFIFYYPDRNFKVQFKLIKI